MNLTNSNQDNNWFEKHPLLTFFFFIFFILIFCELFLKIFFSELTLFEVQPIIPSSTVFKDYKPNSTFIRKPSPQDSFSVVINSINSMGIRGPEIGPKKHYRVINIGDSFIQADEVQFEDTFGQKLNSFFKNKIEFISHGLGSYSPTPEFSWIYHKAIPLEINEVNLFLCINDFFRLDVYGSSDAYYRQFAHYQNNVPISYKVSSTKEFSAIREFLKKSDLVRLLYMTFTKFNTKALQVVPEDEDQTLLNEFIWFSQSEDTWPNELRTSFMQVIEVIKNMKEFLKQKNIKLNITLVPVGFRYDNENVPGKHSPTYNFKQGQIITQNGLENALIDFSNKQNITYINLTKYFDEAKTQHPTILLFNEMDGHWNKNGHDVVFQALKKHYEFSR